MLISLKIREMFTKFTLNYVIPIDWQNIYLTTHTVGEALTKQAHSCITGLKKSWLRLHPPHLHFQ